MFSSECCEIFKNTYFEEHLRTAAVEYTKQHQQLIQINGNLSKSTETYPNQRKLSQINGNLSKSTETSVLKGTIVT